ncbi:MAG: amidase [Planctomycetes bacterium]|nr:amidase [Planctomycetota bacterium]
MSDVNKRNESLDVNRPLDRRTVVKLLAGAGIGTAAFQRAVAAQVQAAGGFTPEMIRQACWIAGLELNEDQQDMAARAVDSAQGGFQAMRRMPVGYDVPPALTFHAAAPLESCGLERGSVELLEKNAVARPESDDELAFLPVSALATLLRTKQISSIELTKLYLSRLKKYDPLLKCVVTLTEETAIEQAEWADREIAAGRYRGPLHGIPWGAKDIIAWPGYKTTWGCARFENQVIEAKATVARRLEDAGAVLVAKLSVGTLAWGDEWFGGVTRNPWNIEEGSSGSSAGPAAATVAGLVGLSLGSETLGSIVSPCRRCGATGLRPTFGRVSRHGCMTLAWSMDKIGPIARSVEDCALIFGAIHGRDPTDATTVDRPFDWPPRDNVSKLRVGYVSGDDDDARPELDALRDLGVTLAPIRLPDSHPIGALTMILGVESSAVFDPLIRTGDLSDLGRWPHSFLKGQFTPAVEYLRANRIRTLLMREMDKLFDETGIDAYVEGNDLALTNLTGHPTVIVPDAAQPRRETQAPATISFTGRLFGESQLLTLAHAFEQVRGPLRRRPVLNVG